MTDYLLAIDQGTTSTRAILFDGALIPVASAQQEFRQIYPGPGLVEHDPEEIWLTVVATARAAMAKADARAADIAAIGIATSARPQLSGTAPTAARSITRSSGRTATPRIAAQRSAKPATRP